MPRCMFEKRDKCHHSVSDSWFHFFVNLGGNWAPHPHQFLGRERKREPLSNARRTVDEFSDLRCNSHLTDSDKTLSNTVKPWECTQNALLLWNHTGCEAPRTQLVTLNSDLPTWVWMVGERGHWRAWDSHPRLQGGQTMQCLEPSNRLILFYCLNVCPPDSHVGVLHPKWWYLE